MCFVEARGYKMIWLLSLLILSVDLCWGQTDTQIRELTKEIWDTDPNKLCNSDVEFDADSNVQLFQYVNEAKLTTPTWLLFRELLEDTYNPEEGVPDVCDAACEQRENDFIDALFLTTPITLAYNFISQYRPEYNTELAFKDYLWNLWFQPYNRHATYDSSGFQHVFLGEIKVENEIGGFHNWYKIYLEEQKGLIDMSGASFPAVCNPDVPKINNMRWQGYSKPINSVWIRSTPEAEIAIYTVAFTFRPNSLYNVDLDNYVVPIQTYDEITGGPIAIGTAYVRCD